MLSYIEHYLGVSNMDQFTDSQKQYLEGQRDGERFYAEGHVELKEKYSVSCPAYQMGFDSQQCKQSDDFAG